MRLDQALDQAAQPISSAPAKLPQPISPSSSRSRRHGWHPISRRLRDAPAMIPSLRTLSVFTRSLLSRRTTRTVTSNPSFRPLLRAMTTSTPSPVLKQPVKLACVQLASGFDKAANLAHAREKVVEAARGGAKIVVLPECFNSPYGCDFFPTYAETLLPGPPSKEQSPSYHALSAMAAETGTFLIGGSIPEADPDPAAKKYYNTSLVFGPDGALLASHRKVHLFDIDIPGKITFRESDVLSPGNKITLVDLPGYGRIAVAICYDIRFPELATIAARRGCFALVYPGAFNLTTGPLHWRLQGQARAMDNQVYVALCSPARDPDPGAHYRAYGHSLVVDPMAQVVVEAAEAEAIVSWELDGAALEATRSGIPLYSQRRFDVYPDVSKGSIRFDEPGTPQ
ncbi:Omega-amidase nit3 [Diatrype stigma]|uniref:Omega-amidase nit3 n=1 Tax=Diatrype stigma TaxID=117547 RepID=A0AAN9UV38_9PEZI